MSNTHSLPQSNPEALIRPILLHVLVAGVGPIAIMPLATIPFVLSPSLFAGAVVHLRLISTVYILFSLVMTWSAARFSLRVIRHHFFIRRKMAFWLISVLGLGTAVYVVTKWALSVANNAPFIQSFMLFRLGDLITATVAVLPFLVSTIINVYSPFTS